MIPLSEAVEEFTAVVSEGNAEQEVAEEITGIIDRNLERILLGPRQKALFSPEGVPMVTEILGTGSYGTAIALDGRVLKITTDPEELQSASVLTGKNLPHVAHIYGSWLLKDVRILHYLSETERQVGVVVLERLDSVGLRTGTGDDNRLSKIVSEVKNRHGVWPHNLRDLSREHQRARLEDASEELQIALLAHGGAIAEIGEGVAELREEGVYGVDVHKGNVGFSDRDGVHKIFDVGVSSAPRTRKPGRLSGAGRRADLDGWPHTAINHAWADVPELR